MPTIRLNEHGAHVAKCKFCHVCFRWTTPSPRLPPCPFCDKTLNQAVPALLWTGYNLTQASQAVTEQGQAGCRYHEIVGGVPCQASARYRFEYIYIGPDFKTYLTTCEYHTQRLFAQPIAEVDMAAHRIADEPDFIGRRQDAQRRIQLLKQQEESLFSHTKRRSK
jgi:hypothetical protein